MDNIEQHVKSMLEKRRYDVIVAIITDKAQMIDSERAKRHFKQYELEILNCKHPTLCRDTSGTYAKTFVFGVRVYMEKELEYLEKFLNACNTPNLTEIIGVKAR